VAWFWGIKGVKSLMVALPWLVWLVVSVLLGRVRRRIGMLVI